MIPIVLTVILAQALDRTSSPVKIGFCELMRDIDSHVGKRIILESIWTHGASGNLLVSVGRSCAQSPFQSYPTNELYLIFPKEEDLEPDDESTTKCVKLNKEFSSQNKRSLRTWVSVTGIVIRFRTNEAAKPREAEYGLFGVWPYALKIQRIAEFER